MCQYVNINRIFSVLELEAEVNRLLEVETKQIQVDNELAEDLSNIFNSGKLLTTFNML